MKAYIKDQIGAVVFFYSQIALVIIIAKLASSFSEGSVSRDVIIYILLIVSFFLLTYHIFRYIKYRDLYQYTEQDATETAWLPDTPDQLTSQLKNHYEKQYKSYRQEIETLRAEKRQENIFMQQWIHQMKTPLSVMRLTLEKEEQEIPHSIRQNLEEELDRLNHGLQLALYQSRLQQFERDFHVDKIKLKEFIHSIIPLYKSSFIRQHVYPKVEINENLVIYSDRKWLGFAIEQITNNAIKYSRNRNSHVLYLASGRKDTIQLIIQDQGVGIPKQDLSRVFDPFFTGENGRIYRESTGMGLYLAKQICDDLGHTIKVDSKPGEGTTFTLIFDND